MDHWNEVAESITGKSIIYVATDETTDTVEKVRQAVSERITIKHTHNTPAGESPSFADALGLIPNGNDDVLLYAHGKGMQDHTFACPAVRLWTELMYETVINNREQIVRRMSEGYRAFGSFRAFGRAPLSPRYRWHYAGDRKSTRLNSSHNVEAN